MATPPENDIQMDAASLYREEVYSDRRVGTIRAFVPVTTAGTPDAGRPVIYSGEVQIVTQVGSLPVGFEIEAKSLAEAVAGYANAAQAAVERTLQELAELRRQAASSIVVPAPGGGFAPSGVRVPGAGGGPGGTPGGGKIRIP